MRFRPAFLVLGLLLGCGGSGGPVSSGPPTVTDPDLFRGVAIQRTSNARFPVVAVHEDGSMLAPLVEAGGLAGAIYLDFDELGKQRHFLVELDDEGRPLRAETGKRVFLFLNHAGDRADVVALGEGTHRPYQGNHPFESLARLRSLFAELRPRIRAGSGARPAELFQFAALAVRAAACVSGVLTSDHPSRTSSPEGIVYPCLAAITGIGADPGAEIGPTDGLRAVAHRFAPCRSGDDSGCVAAVVDRLVSGARQSSDRIADTRASEQRFRESFDAERFAGFWRLRLALVDAEGPDGSNACTTEALEDARVLDTDIEQSFDVLVFRAQLLAEEIQPGPESLAGSVDAQGGFDVSMVFFEGDPTAERRYRIAGVFADVNRLEGSATIVFPAGETGVACRTTWSATGTRLATDPAVG